MLFHTEDLSGVLDFDSVHLDLRATDVACARRSRHDDVVRGYLEIARLTDAELPATLALDLILDNAAAHCMG